MTKQRNMNQIDKNLYTLDTYNRLQLHLCSIELEYDYDIHLFTRKFDGFDLDIDFDINEHHYIVDDKLHINDYVSNAFNAQLQKYARYTFDSTDYQTFIAIVALKSLENFIEQIDQIRKLIYESSRKNESIDRLKLPNAHIFHYSYQAL